ncbi:hypothetical protein WJX72_004743 [[Myrmecia] bisecta]|uniref:Uncharacterized protein n=1 Tax=[Myrmecia] bisecta TaxID=41462 RepID=A0AAW1R7E0_9CHLO
MSTKRSLKNFDDEGHGISRLLRWHADRSSPDSRKACALHVVASARQSPAKLVGWFCHTKDSFLPASG